MGAERGHKKTDDVTAAGPPFPPNTVRDGALTLEPALVIELGHTDNDPPTVLWAQRSSKDDAEKNFIYLTIVVPDADPSQAEITLKPTSVSFKGFSKTLKRTYQVVLDLYAEIDEAASKVNHTSRSVELKLVKKELSDEYWPRLLKDAKKVHFLKTDFDKWVDEDEQDEAPADDFSQFGGMGGGGMGGAMPGGMGGMPGMGGT